MQFPSQAFLTLPEGHFTLLNTAVVNVSVITASRVPRESFPEVELQVESRALFCTPCQVALWIWGKSHLPTSFSVVPGDGYRSGRIFHPSPTGGGG